jgi:NAD+-processing family protein with receiver domain
MTKTEIKLTPNVTCLVVEDNDIRNDWFARVLPNFDIARTADEALVFLGAQIQHPYDMVFLDHDCIHGFVDPTDPDFLNKTFWRVAQALHRTEYPTTVVIHSGNPVGAARMAALIKSVNPHVYVMPFGSFDVRIER